jgi:hypothetical protein
MGRTLKCGEMFKQQHRDAPAKSNRAKWCAPRNDHHSKSQQRKMKERIDALGRALELRSLYRSG